MIGNSRKPTLFSRKFSDIFIILDYGITVCRNLRWNSIRLWIWQNETFSSGSSSVLLIRTLRTEQNKRKKLLKPASPFPIFSAHCAWRDFQAQEASKLSWDNETSMIFTAELLRSRTPQSRLGEPAWLKMIFFSFFPLNKRSSENHVDQNYNCERKNFLTISRETVDLNIFNQVERKTSGTERKRKISSLLFFCCLCCNSNSLHAMLLFEN